MANKVNQEDILNINRLYLRLKTYAAVARQTGFSPSTVKKYVVPGFQEVEEKAVRRYTGNLPVSIDLSNFDSNNWNTLCVLSDEEREEIKELWEEILL